MKNRPKHRITLEEAIKNIPYDECYCNDRGTCPFFRLRYLTRTKMLRIAKDKDWFGIPACHYKRNRLEYCLLLDDWLSVQDGIKDCGINKFYIDEDIEQSDKKRICCREAADMYKEMFPEESDLIDKIIEEDHVEYRYKEDKINVN